MMDDLLIAQFGQYTGKDQHRTQIDAPDPFLHFSSQHVTSPLHRMRYGQKT